MKRRFGRDDPLVALVKANLGQLYTDRGLLKKAAPLLRSAVEIGTAKLGPANRLVILSQVNLSLLLYRQGKYDEAQRLLRRILPLATTTLGKEHPEVAIILNTLSLVLLDQGRNLSEAESLMKQAISIGEKSLGPEHPDTAIWLNNLGLIYAAEENYTDAVTAISQALAIDVKRLGEDHPTVATIEENLSEVLRKLGRVDKAKKHAEEPQLFARENSARSLPPPFIAARRTRQPLSARQRPCWRARCSTPRQRRSRCRGASSATLRFRPRARR